jgi:hypothetical protein
VFARAVTEVLAPAVLVAVVSPLVAWHCGALGWGIAVAVFAAGVPFAFILRGVRRGSYDNRHVGDWRVVRRSCSWPAARCWRCSG